MFLRILVLVGSIAGLLTTIDTTAMANGGDFSFSDQSGIWIVFLVLFITSIISISKYTLILVGSIVGLLTTIDTTAISNGGDFSFSDQSGIWVFFLVLFITSVIFLTLKKFPPYVVQEHNLNQEKIRKNLKKIRKNYSEKINWKK
tara:strand:+ start:83 stop:517 length:435 start_codon:yes stop_codon:yes gene_type:complete